MKALDSGKSTDNRLAIGDSAVATGVAADATIDEILERTEKSGPLMWSGNGDGSGSSDISIRIFR